VTEDAEDHTFAPRTGLRVAEVAAASPPRPVFQGDEAAKRQGSAEASRVTLADARRCSVVRGMHADGAAIFAVDALPAQRTTVAVRAEAREPSTITTARPDHHERAGRAANRIVGQVDLESVLGEFALGATCSPTVGERRCRHESCRWS